MPAAFILCMPVLPPRSKRPAQTDPLTSIFFVEGVKHMSKKVIHSDLAPKAIGPYSQAVAANGFLFVSGQLGIDVATGGMSDDVVEQTKQALRNLDAILREAGCGPENVVKTTVLLEDMAHFGAVNEVYGDYFASPFPARACFAVRQLPKRAKVEIECIAMLG